MYVPCCSGVPGGAALLPRWVALAVIMQNTCPPLSCSPTLEVLMGISRSLAASLGPIGCLSGAVCVDILALGICLPLGICWSKPGSVLRGCTPAHQTLVHNCLVTVGHGDELVTSFYFWFWATPCSVWWWPVTEPALAHSSPSSG